MAGCEFLRFLVAVDADTRLGNALREAAPDLCTAGDLVRFAARYGYRFTEADIPMAAARRDVDQPTCGDVYGGGALV